MYNSHSQMNTIVVIASIVAACAAVFACLLSWRATGKADGDSGKLDLRLESIERAVKDAQTAVDKLQAGMDMQQKAMESLRANVNDRIDKNRGETTEVLNQFRKELTDMSQKQQENADALRGEIKKEIESFRETIESFRLAMSEGLDKMRENVDDHLERMRAGNEKKLDEMRQTVDEKLEKTLHKRIEASFGNVAKRLEDVQKGLGKMESVSDTMGDLQRVLARAPIRGRMGEEMLEDILRDTLAPDQYEKNWKADALSGESVEFAIKIPQSSGDHLWLPVDSKFPLEDYEHYARAMEEGDKEEAGKRQKKIIRSFEMSAKTIQEKYITPSAKSTEFAVMFVPNEGLYSVLVNEPGFSRKLQQQYRVTAAGPHNFHLLTSTIRVGMQLFAISEQSSEVREVLGLVKNEFEAFGKMLDKAQKHLRHANQSIDDTRTKSESMQKKLRSVETMPQQAVNDTPSLPDLDKE